MTQPTHPTRPPDPRFVRDVATQIDRRRTRRRLTLWTLLLALVAAGAAYLRCGGSLGLGGLGGGGDDGEGGQHTLAGPPRCTIRLSAGGITVDGRAASRDEAVAACKTASGVDLFWTGDARHGDREALLAALRAAKLDIALHEPRAPAGAQPASSGSSAAPGEPGHR